MIIWAPPIPAVEGDAKPATEHRESKPRKPREPRKRLAEEEKKPEPVVDRDRKTRKPREPCERPDEEEKKPELVVEEEEEGFTLDENFSMKKAKNTGLLKKAEIRVSDK